MSVISLVEPGFIRTANSSVQDPPGVIIACPTSEIPRAYRSSRFFEMDDSIDCREKSGCIDDAVLDSSPRAHTLGIRRSVVIGNQTPTNVPGKTGQCGFQR